MARVRLLHWKAAEAALHIDLLRRAGHEIEYDEQFRPALLRGWRESPPEAFVIDLSRLPSHGREIAIALRQSPLTRRIPLVFVDGTKEKVDRIRTELPDASYCSSAKLSVALEQALAHPPDRPVKPVQMMERYGARTAPQKLGIKPGSTLALVNPPRDVMKVLGELPRDVAVVEGNGAGAAVTLCFVNEAHSVRQSLSKLREMAGQTKLWILWPKGGSTSRGDLTESLVRENAIDLGLVDYKICSVNQMWSAILFALKR
ncbi:MAG: hypothetical protein JO097_03615 [Acidobacteriaceae bacterium]|nr:hypothetical protein [Acidobacteriaceae bacterium]MBV9767576.1 hypothetical protein [Acidobacteriaceae bacterium]